MPNYAKWFNGWSYWLIAIGLMVALYNLLKTFKVFLNTKKMRKLTSVLQSQLRNYLTIFTASYVFVSFLAVIGYINDWDLSSDPVDWKFEI